MGLDIVMYDKANNRIGFYEMPEIIHNELFNSQYYRSYIYLRELKDYYKTNKVFTKGEIDGLILDLTKCKSFISLNAQAELNKLLHSLSNTEVRKIQVAGD